MSIRKRRMFEDFLAEKGFARSESAFPCILFALMIYDKNVDKYNMLSGVEIMRVCIRELSIQQNRSEATISAKIKKGLVAHGINDIPVKALVDLYYECINREDK